MPLLMRSCALLLAGLALGAAASAVSAQDGSRALVPPGWHVRKVRVEGTPAPAAPRAERGLTVRRHFAPPAGDEGVFLDGGTIYGDVSAFVPEPRVDSGVQFPYGLDGIGGYGSDLGFGAGNDSLVYDRGALDRAGAVSLGER